ncbi:MAG: hypothetical protein EPO27_07770 [Betaproteobacteria bacterium]|nr:MAG: hypothetical protein EPO27_07770 [Betaproteobacteria bacterium]
MAPSRLRSSSTVRSGSCSCDASRCEGAEVNASDVHAGFYPERDATPESVWDRAWSAGEFWIRQLFRRRVPQAAPFAHAVARCTANVDAANLDAQIPGLRFRLRRTPRSGALLAECFGLYCAALRGSGSATSTPSPEVLGAARILMQGGVAEIAGMSERRCALALAAAAMALRGTPVHLLSSSEARARGLSEVMREPMAALGIGVGVVTQGMDARARGAAYANLVVCGALREIGIDYLRDRMSLGGRPRRVLGRLDRLSGDTAADRHVLSGMHCALVDDADRLMLDDSRVPLAISTETDQSGERLLYEQALELARVLRETVDFTIGVERTELTPECSRRLAQLTQALGGVWAARERREELIALALDALHVAQRDRDYRVIQGRVQFPPEPAGTAEEPSVERLLLQKLVEVKEGCRLSGRRVVLAQISVPRVLGRYLHLAGVCGDARGLEREFWRSYRLHTAQAAPYPPPVPWTARLFAGAKARQEALIECVRSGDRRAIVIGLRSPAEAHALLEAFAQSAIQAGVASGAGSAAEQQAVAGLDTPGAVLVSIYPAERNVLHARASAIPVSLLVAELHDGERHVAHIARAYGATACEVLLSLEDEDVKKFLGPRAVAAAGRAMGSSAEAPPGVALRCARRALTSAARAAAAARRDALMAERSLDDLLAFSGQRE